MPIGDLFRAFNGPTHLPIYKPLDFNGWQFRLLTIQPVALDGVDDIVKCKMETCTLIEHPRYRALSYCWGDPRDTRTISLDGQIVSVTSNLEAGLRRLRTRGFYKVWVDALCINQKDMVERGLQVLRMGLIFSKAFEVIAWLGASDISLGELEMSKDKNGDSRTPHDITRILSRSFWRRIWIIQEIAKASSIQLLYDDRVLSWPVFNTILDKMEDVPDEVKALRDFRVQEIARDRQKLYHAMAKTYSFQATDPRDKIYALLGLTSDGAEFVPTPNYTQQSQIVYFEAFKAMILGDRDLAYLCNRDSKSTHIAEEGQQELDWTKVDFPLWLDPKFDGNYSWLRYPQQLHGSLLPSISRSGLTIFGRCLGTVTVSRLWVPRIPIGQCCGCSYRHFMPKKSAAPGVGLLLKKARQKWERQLRGLPIPPSRLILARVFRLVIDEENTGWDEIMEAFVITNFLSCREWDDGMEVKSKHDLLWKWFDDNERLVFSGEYLSTWITRHAESPEYTFLSHMTMYRAKEAEAAHKALSSSHLKSPRENLATCDEIEYLGRVRLGVKTGDQVFRVKHHTTLIVMRKVLGRFCYINYLDRSTTKNCKISSDSEFEALLLGM